MNKKVEKKKKKGVFAFALRLSVVEVLSIMLVSVSPYAGKAEII